MVRGERIFRSDIIQDYPINYILSLVDPSKDIPFQEDPYRRKKKPGSISERIKNEPQHTHTHTHTHGYTNTQPYLPYDLILFWPRAKLQNQSFIKDSLVYLIFRSQKHLLALKKKKKNTFKIYVSITIGKCPVFNSLFLIVII